RRAASGARARRGRRGTRASPGSPSRGSRRRDRCGPRGTAWRSSAACSRPEAGAVARGAMHAIGIDLGGTKIEGVVLDAELRPVHRVRVATERERGYEHILERIAGVLAALRPHAPKARVVGIGTPGSLSARDGTLKNSNTTCLNGRALHADLEERL